MKGDYDKVALVYDRLSRLVYGSTLADAQLYLLQAIPAGARVLIAGGGTGWLLEEIVKRHPSGLVIDYVDVSAAMIRQAQKRNRGDNEVNFIQGRAEEVLSDADVYDIVITPFLFDNFSEATAQTVFSAIDKSLKPEGVWLYCDFRNTDNWRHKMLLKSMYLFFRLCCGIEARQLPDIMEQFSAHYYHALGETTFMKGFIVSGIYKRV